MDKNLHDIDDLFMSGLDENKELPSLKVWEVIDQRLDKEKVALVQRKYKAMKRLSVLLLFLLTGLCIYELNTRRANSSLTKIKTAGIVREQLPESQNRLMDNYKEFLPEQNISKVKETFAPSSILTANTMVVDNRLNFDQSTNETPGHGSFQQHSPISGFYTQQNIGPGERINRQIAVSPFVKDLFHLPSSTKNYPSLDFTYPRSTPEKKKTTGTTRFSITGLFSPDIAAYHLEEDQPGNQPETASKIEKAERHEFSSTSGFLFDYSMNKRWSLESGILFSNTNITLQPKMVYAQPDNNGDIKYRVNISSGYSFLRPSFQNSPLSGDSIEVTAATHKLRYIGFPLAIKYRTGKGRLIFEATAGIAVNFLTKGKLETEIRKGVNSEVDILNNIQGLKPVYFNISTGIGADYRLTKKLSIILTPTARFALDPINKGSVVKTFPNSFGLAGGLKIRF